MAKAKPSKPGQEPSKYRPIADNRRATYEFEILERLEVGLELLGVEVKSLRMGQVQMAEAYVRMEGMQAHLHQMHVAPYSHGNIYNADPVRVRRLLMHKMEIRRWYGKTKEKGLTVVPLRLYWKGDWAKLEIGLARGKKLHDKRAAKKEQAIKRDTQRALMGRD